MESSTINWIYVITIVGANIAVLMGFMGTAVALIIYGNKKMDIQLKAISDEMKDFHGRLVSIEERASNRILK